MKNTVVYNVLKVTWTRHGSIKMTEVDDKTMNIKFESEREKEEIMDKSPWSVQGHCLNLKECKANTCLKEIDFYLMKMWIQIYGLNLNMYNPRNAY